jgi:hypothetical protein
VACGRTVRGAHGRRRRARCRLHVDLGGGAGCRRGVQIRAGVAVLSFVPREEQPAVLPGRSRSRRIGRGIGRLFHRLELTFAVGVVMPRSASRNATGLEVTELPRSAWMVNWSRPICARCRSAGSDLRPAPPTRRDHPADGVAGQNSQDHVEVVVEPFRRAAEFGDPTTTPDFGALATNFGLALAGESPAGAAPCFSPARRSSWQNVETDPR